MSFKTNTPVVQSLVTAGVTSGLTAALGTTVQAHSTLLDSVAGITLTGNGNRAIIVNSGGTALTLSALLGTAAFTSTGTAAGNIPVIGAGGKLDSALLPALDVVDVFTVADLAARDALTATKGDVAVVTSLSKTYIYSGSAWVEMISPSSTGSVTSVAGKTGVVTLALSDLTDVVTTGNAAGHTLRFDGTKFVSAVLAYGDLTGAPVLGTASSKATEFFATAVHTHVAADITDLNTVVDGKVSAAVAAIPAVDKSIASVSVITTSATVDGTAQIIVVNGTAAVTVTLPAAPATGKIITVKDGAGIATASNVTVAGGGKNIDGATSTVITANYESVTLVYNGTQWNLI